jgi:hypothetical protein
MVEVAERCLPSVCDAELWSGFPLQTAMGFGDEESVLGRVGSTIAPGDDVCSGESEAASHAAVAEPQRRTGLAVEQLVPSALLHTHERRSEMSVSTPVSRTARLGRPRLLVLIVALTAVVAVAAWAIASGVIGSGSQPGEQSVATPAPGPVQLVREERRFVESLAAASLAQLDAQQGILTPAPAPSVLVREQRRFLEGLGAMSLAQLRAASRMALMTTSPLGSMTPVERRRNNAVLASLTPTERRYVRGIESMSYAQLAAAFGMGR